MRQFFNNISIKAKLIFLLSLSAFIALFISFSIMSLYNIEKDRKWSLVEASKLVAVSGKNLVAALTFLDAKAVEAILLPIFADEDVLSIKVYDANANLFVDVAGVGKNIDLDLKIELKELTKEYSHISYDHIEIVSPIYFEDEIIGFIEIIKSTNKIKEKLKAQFVFSIFVVFITLAIIFILSFWFEKLFSNPIYFLLNTIREIQKSGNYNINIISKSKDEFNELYHEFNHMIDQICSRDRILQEHNLTLENLVHSTVDELKKTKENLKEATVLATIDPLTGLANRREVMDRFEAMIEYSKINNYYLGVLMADIDNFKKINDTYGHQTGDEVIQKIGSILHESIRKYDIAARIGGEEFLILFENCDPVMVKEVAHRIRKKVQGNEMLFGDRDKFNATISLGFCCVIPKNLNKKDLLKIADDALYKAKSSGRNMVVEGIAE